MAENLLCASNPFKGTDNRGRISAVGRETTVSSYLLFCTQSAFLKVFNPNKKKQKNKKKKKKKKKKTTKKKKKNNNNNKKQRKKNKKTIAPFLSDFREGYKSILAKLSPLKVYQFPLNENTKCAITSENVPLDMCTLQTQINLHITKCVLDTQECKCLWWA